MDGRIIIDTYAWNRFNPNLQVQLNTLNQPRAQPLGSQTYADDDYSEDEYTDYGDDDMDDDIIDVVDQPGKARQQALTKDQLLLCSATLKGYSLKNKKWRKWKRSDLPAVCVD